MQENPNHDNPSHWKPGESGNPAGSRDRTMFIRTLDRAIAQESGKSLRKAAEKLLARAAEGEPWALQMLADRLDGRPAQSLEITDRREGWADVIQRINGQRVVSEQPQPVEHASFPQLTQATDSQDMTADCISAAQADDADGMALAQGIEGGT